MSSYDSLLKPADSAGKLAGGNVLEQLGFPFAFFPATGASHDAVGAGSRFGAKGTHTSWTIMFDELQQVLAAALTGARRQDYAQAIIEGNCLSKPTFSTRRLTNQRLGELYALDPSVPAFRVLRRLW